MPSYQPTAGMSAVKPEYLSSQPSPMAKTSEPNRSTRYDPKKPHITDTPITKKNWYKHVNWLNVTLIIGIPIYGCIAAFWVPLQWKTCLFAVAYYFATGLGITAGETRLPIHKLVEALLTRRSRLPSSVGTHLLLRNPAPPNFPRCRWWWGC